MEKFNIDYDEENDNLFVYLEGKKSNGAVEIGNFALDFDENGSLVAMEILDASKVLATILSKMIKLARIKEFRANIINFRNMAAIKFSISDETQTESSSIILPRIIEKSPALKY